jgi:hypothetical protein
MTSKVTYWGFKTSSVHLQSGTEILSDAPLDNNGRSCFLTNRYSCECFGKLYDDRYGYKARDLEVDLQGFSAAVTKIMNIDPRRIGAIDII